MKKLQLTHIINIVLGIGLIVMYVLHFTSKSNTTKPSDESTIAEGEKVEGAYKPNFAVALNGAAKLPIAYIDMEKLSDGYKYFKNENQKFAGKEQEIISRYAPQEQALQAQLEKNAMLFQSGKKSEAAARLEEEQLAQKAQQIQMQKQQEVEAFYKAQENVLKDAKEKITAYLKKYSKEFKYSYVLGVGEGSSVLYSNDSLNITDEVIKGLNSEYDLRNK